MMKSDSSTNNQLDEKLLERLACPQCKGALDYDRQKPALECAACRLRFAIKEGIPILLSDQAEQF